MVSVLGCLRLMDNQGRCVRCEVWGGLRETGVYALHQRRKWDKGRGPRADGAAPGAARSIRTLAISRTGRQTKE
jgi:hypothetical protein